MKARQNAGTSFGASPRFEFIHQRPGNRLRVEHDLIGGVIIRAALDNFTPRDKKFFIRYLAEEGFICGRHLGSASHEAGPWPGIEWLVEDGNSEGPSPSPGAIRSAKTVMVRLLVGATVVWLIELAVLLHS